MTSIPPRLREQVRQRANKRCEYCSKPEDANFFGHQVDHIIPERHGGSSILANFAWACFRCNNSKGTDIASYDPITRELTPLYNPRTQKWDEHFEMDEDGIITAKTPIARVTIRILDMNRPRQVEIRRNLIESGLW
jgi:HNH endonuclease